MNNMPNQAVADSQITPRSTKSRWWKRVMPGACLLIAIVTAGVVLLVPGTTAATAPRQPVRVIKAYPHDAGSFCQGLVVYKGHLLEGTGHYNQSRLRQVALESGQPSIDVALPGEIFGEGVTVWNDTILQLTWKNGYLITYDAATLRRTGTVAFRSIAPDLREGWGITHDGQQLIISDGSSVLRFVDPTSFRLVRQVRVKDGVRPLTKLNELEYVNGEILANVWYRDEIARIDPATGRVTGWLDLSPLRPAAVRNDREAVLNGIAWDAINKRQFVTGKTGPCCMKSVSDKGGALDPDGVGERIDVETSMRRDASVGRWTHWSLKGLGKIFCHWKSHL